jgi:hypothetical protein
VSQQPAQPLATDRSRPELRTIAKTQRTALVGLLVFFCGVMILAFLTKNVPVITALAFVFVALVAASVFMLALRLYGLGTGMVLGFLALGPCLGLVVLMILNGKATTVLRNHGVKVGFMGAGPSAIDALPPEVEEELLQIDD